MGTPKSTGGSSATSSRPQRSVRRKRIIYSDDESDKENSDSHWSDNSSNSDSELLTDDDGDGEIVPTRQPKSVRGKKTTAERTPKRTNKKLNKNDLIQYLDLSKEVVVEVDENFHANVAEDELANITQRFLETDLNAEA